MKIYLFIFSFLILEIFGQDDVAENENSENSHENQDKILSRKKRIDEVNEDYDRKAFEHENLQREKAEELPVDSDPVIEPEMEEAIAFKPEIEPENTEMDEQEKIIQEHAEVHRKIHEKAVADAAAAAGQLSQGDTVSNTETHTETVQTVHTEVKNTETDEILNNKIQITKTETNSDGTISEQHFEATIERVDPDGTLITSDPEPISENPNPGIPKASEDLENFKNPEKSTLGSIMENAINVQKELAEKPKEKIRVMREIEIDGVKIYTADTVEDESDPELNLKDHDKFNEWEEEYVKSQLKLRYQKQRRVDVTKTQFISIDHLRPKLLPPLGQFEPEFPGIPNENVDYSLKCVSPWILNGEPILEKCIRTLRKDKKPWCSLDEVFQGNFEFCPESPEDKLERETKLERERLMQEGLDLISGWDGRRSVIKSGYEKLDEAYRLGHMNCTGMVAWAKLGGFFMPLNVKEARSLAEDGALRGRSMDQAVLGFMHAIGVGFKADQAKALLYWSFAAAGGTQTAHMALGFRYLKGIGVKPNCEKALHHYQYVGTRVGSSVAFSGGTAKAKLPLEFLREQTLDDSGLHDVNLINYYELLVTQGETNAMLQLAQLLIDRGYEPDCRRAAELLKKASVDHPVAAARLGRLYMDGRGVPQDWRSALDWFKLAAEKSNPMGQTYLGVLYEMGKHTPTGGAPKYLEAFQYYTKAADSGFAEAQYRLGMAYYNGFGTKQDIRLAVKYLQLASQHQNMRAILKLAELQATGRGIPRSCQGAVDMYKNVAERGLYARLFMQAAQQYKQEKYQSAYILYSILAELGFSVAQQNVAQLLEEAEITITGEENKYPRALMNFNRAADQGLSNSRVKVGDYNYYGYGTAEDMTSAGQHYRQAAEEGGNSQAFFNLGWMHQHGFGLDKDKFLAKRYYDQAMEVNPTEATFPATLAIVYLHAEGLIKTASGYLDGVTLAHVNERTEQMVMQYVGANWDIYFGAFLFCILIFVIAFRRQ